MGAAAYGDATVRPIAVYAHAARHLQPASRTGRSTSTARWPTGPAAFSTSPTRTTLDRASSARRLRPRTCGIPTRCCASRTSSTRPDTQERLDKAAATQMVFEDALIHVIDHLHSADRQRPAGADRRHRAQRGRPTCACSSISTRPTTSAMLGKRTRLHSGYRRRPNDAGVTIGAAYMFALARQAQASARRLRARLLLRQRAARDRNPVGARQRRPMSRWTQPGRCIAPPAGASRSPT